MSVMVVYVRVVERQSKDLECLGRKEGRARVEKARSTSTS